MPVLYLNVMDGLSTQIGKDAFLWATDRPGNDRLCYAAEKFAHEVEYLAASLRPMIGSSFNILRQMRELKGQPAGDFSAGNQDDLMNFILKRHANYRHGGNVNPEYCEAA